MIIFRFLGTQQKRAGLGVNEAYQNMRNKRIMPNETQLAEFFQRIHSFDEISLTNLSYILSASYKPRSVYDSYFNILEKELNQHILKFSDVSFMRIILNFQYAYKHQYKSFSKETLDFLIQRAKLFSTPSKKISLILELSKLIGLFKEKKTDYEGFFVKVFMESSASLKSLSKEDLISLLETYSRLYLTNSSFMSDSLHGPNMFHLLQDELTAKLSLLSTNETAAVLKAIQSGNSDREDFFQSLEEKLLPKLSEIKDGEMPGLMKSYTYRKLHNYFYMINTVFKELYEDLLNRFDTMEASVISQYLTEYKTCASIHGLYCDQRLHEKCMKKLKIAENIQDDWKQLKACLGILSFFNHTGLSGAQELISKVLSLQERKVKHMHLPSLLVLAHEVSRSPEGSESFWSLFSEKLLSILQATEKPSALYAIHLNLSLQFPSIHTIIEPILRENMNFIKDSWKSVRTREIETSESSRLHKNFSIALSNLHIKHSVEYYDEYFIDIAIPEKKLAYEILGPGHYIFPSSQLNGRTQNKKKNLEKLGWTCTMVPFFQLRPTVENLMELITKTFPLDH